MLGTIFASLRLIKNCAWLTLFVLVFVAAQGAAAPARAEADTLRVGTYGPPPGLGNPYKGAWRPGVYTWAAIFA